MSNKSRKGAGLAIAVCFTAAIIMAGTYALNGVKESEEELAMLEEEQESKITKAEELVISTKEDDGTEDEERQASAEDKSSDMNNSREAADGTVDGNKLETDSSSGNENVTAQTAGTNISVNFTEDSHMLWPVDGNLLMGYSMDQTVYFSTLDQYKYNPAMIISGAEGDQVIAGAAGVVKSIDNTAQTGLTVNIDLGNGYEVMYGQLKDIPLNVGDYVAANSVIGYVAQPTKYYVAEGCNVYFEMRKDGQPIDPLEYIEH